MLIAFGEDPNNIENTILEVKSSKERKAQKEDIKIWFLEK
jgi:hypothetical protein